MAPVGEGQFQIYDHRRFGDVIEDVLAELKSEGTWKGDLKQQRRIMQAFAWITGNRELGSYDHRDVARFKNGLKRLPKKFYYGTLTTGAMSRPFDDVATEIPPVAPSQQRNNKTINRDLSTMSTVAKHLAQTSWKPKIANTTVMDFASGTIAIEESDSTDLRPPWTTAHLKCLFESPLYTGGGAAKRRLKAGDGFELSGMTPPTSRRCSGTIAMPAERRSAAWKSPTSQPTIRSRTFTSRTI